jgi:hypothetical protein
MDRVASLVQGCIDNRSVRMFVFNMHQRARHACCCCNVLRLIQMSTRRGLHAFLVPGSLLYREQYSF